MASHEAIDKAQGKMEKTIDALKNEFVSIRAGRANAQILNRIMVDYYGTPTPIPQVGNVSTPEPRMLTISLWDNSMLKEVEKAIIASDLGITPTNDGKIIRLVFPEPTAERRKELVKVAKNVAEEYRQIIRAHRRDAIEALRKDKKDGNLTEDDLSLLEKEVQNLTDKFGKKVEDLLKEKESEIMEI